MKFSFNTCHFILLVAAACAVISAAEKIIDLGTACDFAILAKSGITNVPYSVINGNIGVSPIAGTAITGFSLTADASNVFSSSGQVSGHCLAANYGGRTPATLTQAVLDMETAYTEGNNRLATYAIHPGDAGDISGKTLYSGVYKFTVAINIATDITLDAQDDPNAVFIITTTGGISLAPYQKMVLANGARSDKIFWHVAGHATIGVGAHMEGNILSKTGISINTGGSVNGRLLAQTAVTLQMAVITGFPGCEAAVRDPLFELCSL